MTADPTSVLLVEDSPSDAVLLQESLHEPGNGHFEFVHADSWAQAAECLQQGRFDVLLLDLSLPDSAGRDTFLRARVQAPQLPIVVLTGIADEAIALDALRQGIQDYLVKGQLDGRQLARAIRYAIERRHVENALKETEAALRESQHQLREANLELEHRVAARTAQLEETNSNLEDFSHSITHDLRAPLRAIRAFAQILQENCAACPKADPEGHIQRIIAAAARMDRLIQDVLQYSRLARTEMRLVPVDAETLLRGIIESYPALQPSHAEIQLQRPLPPILGNEAALTQCFSNLLDNAVKFVAPGVRPQVRIWAESVQGPEAEVQSQEAPVAEHSTLKRRPASDPSTPEPRHPAPGPRPSTPAFVRLWFADNGIGIPKEAQQSIFRLYQRLDKRFDGTGVGLTVVRKAVEKMGGRVGLASEEGQGSRFWLELKTASDPAHAP